MLDTQTVIDNLKNHSITIRELSYDQVEDIVYHVTKGNFIKASIKSSSIKRYKKGPIDIIVKVPYKMPEIGFLSSNKKYYLIYVECKHYKRKLEFDRAAKVFVVALRDFPNELVIVSTSGLAEQALEYANHFFSTEFNEGFFKQIHFKLVSLENIIGIPDLKKVRKKAKPKLISDHSDIKIMNLKLIETDGFVQRIAWEHKSPPIKLYLSNSFQYFFEIETTVQIHPNHNVYAKLPLKEKELKSISQPIEFKTKRLNWYSIDDEIVECLIAENNINITIREEDFEEVANSVLNVPNISIDPLYFFLIAPQDWEIQINKIISFSDLKIVFITGEAGIGKSRFCELLCAKLRFQNGFRCHRISINEEFSEHSLLELLWPIILPNLSEAELRQDQVLLSIIRDSLKAFMRDEDESGHIAEMMVSGNLRSIDSQTIAFLLGKILALNPVPQAIFVKDCHYLSPELLRLFRTLIGKLSDDGWGKVMIIFEFRESYEWRDSEFNTFAMNIRSNYHHKTHSLLLTHFKERDLANALSKCIIGNDAPKLASIVFKKAGGNPLFIRNILLWGIDSSFIAITQIDKGKLFIFDWQALTDQIEILPSSIDSLLTLRIKKLLMTNVAQNEKFILYATSLVYISQLLDFSSLLELLLKNYPSDILAFNHLLITAEILKPSLNLSGINFMHELIWLALKNELNSLSQFIAAASIIETILNRNNLLHAIAGARLLFDSKQMQKSLLWYQFGYELAKSENKFQYKRISLYGCKNVLDQELSTPDLGRKKISINLDLAWNELQAGSQLKALDILDDLIDYIVEAEIKIVSNNERKILLQDAYWRKLVALTRLMDPISFIEVFELAFKNAESDAIKISILTRLILISCFTNFPKCAYIIVQRILSSKIQLSGESLGSLYSDIGRIYLQAIPMESLKWWQAGIPYAESERQKCHMEVNLLVGSLYVSGSFPDQRTFADLKNRIREMGVENQYIRLTLLEGIEAVANKDLSKGEYVFMKALEKSQIVNQIFWQWKCNNNLGIVYLLIEKYEQSVEHFKKAFALLEKAIAFSENDDELILRVCDLSKKLNITQIKYHHPALVDPPNLSGLLNVLIHNLNSLKELVKIDNQFAEKIPQMKDLPINVPLGNPLMVSKNGYILFFAIE